MWVLGIYVVLIIIGDVIDFAIGAALIPYTSDAFALMVFLTFYFVTFWLAWVIAVKIAESRNLTT
jgi:hypothetical protein